MGSRFSFVAANGRDGFSATLEAGARALERDAGSPDAKDEVTASQTYPARRRRGDAGKSN
jgi:hypothetical protein